MLKIQYRDAKDGGIEVLRCFSKEDQVEIPSEIDGKRVTKIGDYAFSAHKRKEDEAKEIIARGGFVKTMWCGELDCELKMKEEAGLSSRCMPFEQEHLSDVCPCCGKPAKTMVYWGIAY